MSIKNLMVICLLNLTSSLAESPLESENNTLTLRTLCINCRGLQRDAFISSVLHYQLIKSDVTAPSIVGSLTTEML